MQFFRKKLVEHTLLIVITNYCYDAIDQISFKTNLLFVIIQKLMTIET